MGKLSVRDMEIALLGKSMYATEFDSDNVKGWVVIHRPFEPDNVGAERVGVGATKEEAIRNAYALLPQPVPAFAPLKAKLVAERLTGATNKHEGKIRGFYHLSEAWYADANLKNRSDKIVDQVMIGFFGSYGEGGTTGEFAIEWHDIGGKTHPRLQVFDDAWEALTHFSDLLVEMAKLDNTDPTPAEFCKLLIQLGIKDLTPRTRP